MNSIAGGAPPAVLVLGTHRSGTSAATRVLNLLGVELGARVLPPVAGDNDRGFWENRDAFDIDERLLAGVGRSWHDIRDMPAGWLESPAASQARAEIQRFVEAEFKSASLWAVKDPRMCRLSPVWLRALGELTIKPGILFVVRHPLEVAASLEARNGWTAAHSLLLWTQHLLEAERATREIPRVMVTYDQVMADWPGTVERVARALDITWGRPVDEARPEIEAFLDAGARHHQIPADAGAALPLLVSELYETCLELSRDTDAWERLQRGAEEFGRVAALYGPCIEEFVVYAHAAQDHAQRAETGHALAALRHDLARMAGNVPDRSELERTLAALRQDLAPVAASAAGSADIERTATGLRQDLALMTRTLAEQVEAIGGVERALAALRQDVEHVTRGLAKQAESIAAVEGQLARRQPRRFPAMLRRLLGRA